ncbi:MAG: Na(+)-translocating NADH-quinone reductase subunit A [Marinilabiliales bacterium]
MANFHKIKKGLDIRLKGRAVKELVETEKPEKIAVKPTDFHGVTPKLTVKQGDQVKAGTPLFFNKYRPEVLFTAPVSGVVSDIHRGERRKILEVIIDPDNQGIKEKFDTYEQTGDDNEKIKNNILKSGLWPFIIQRPYNVIANPNDIPQHIYISGFDSAPLAPDYDFLYSEDNECFNLGVDVLSKLTPGKVHLSINMDKETPAVFKNINNVEVHMFSGPHPAGNVGIQIHKINPLNKGDLVWTISPLGVIMIGRLFKYGYIDSEIVVALTGSEVINPKYYKTVMGAQICSITKDNIKNENVRIISGNVLTGNKVTESGFLSFYHQQLTVIPEGNYYRFLGWAMPGFKRYSTSRTFPSWLSQKKERVIDTNLNGGKRAFIMTGEYERVLPMDIYPQQLLKAILVEDIDKMENLGIYEIAEEDLALCEFVCTSKIDVQEIVRQGLDLMIKELT